ncbi:MAG: helix-hairpin-helix domain-containing protein [Bacteroidota bacterium]|jgi:DNA uptake protein ComE-like DNA-binding protein
MWLNSIKNQVKSFLAFNKQQERGAFFLITLIIISFAIHAFLPFILKEKPYDYSIALAEIENWNASAQLINDNKDIKNYKSSGREEVELVEMLPFPFNPNKLPEEKWLEMGMPESIVKTILKFESKGGRFYKAEDLTKIYGLTDAIYFQIKDFIIIPDNQKHEISTATTILSPTNAKIEKVKIDINRGDSVDFLKVSGIGPFYAGQIVKYRNRLGGYVSMKQISELYKMDSVRFNSMTSGLIFNDTVIQKINLNTCDFKTALKHPYMDYALVQKIFNYRNKLGKINGFYQLRKDSIISETQFRKMEAYFIFD